MNTIVSDFIIILYFGFYSTWKITRIRRLIIRNDDETDDDKKLQEMNKVNVAVNQPWNRIVQIMSFKWQGDKPTNPNCSSQ